MKKTNLAVIVSAFLAFSAFAEDVKTEKTEAVKVEKKETKRKPAASCGVAAVDGTANVRIVGSCADDIAEQYESLGATEGTITCNGRSLCTIKTDGTAKPGGGGAGGR